MEKLKQYLVENKLPILGAIIQWFITTLLQVDRAFFIYDYETKYYIIVKILYLLFLFVTWAFIVNAIRKIKEGNLIYRRGMWVFIIYFSLMMILLLILWPGTWAWDDIGTLMTIQCYSSFNAWQHILSGIYQDVMLQILPFPGGIILLQNIIVSLCVTFSVTKLEMGFNIIRLKWKGLDILLKILPFLLPPVLMYQFSGYRLGLYVYLELAMLVILVCAVKDGCVWNLKYILLFSFLTIVVATWRTESFVYIPCACVLVLLMKKSTISLLKKVFCITLILVGFIGINRWQNIELGSSDYQIMSLLRPSVELVRAADYEEDAEEFALIDKVIDLEVIHNNPTLNGEHLFWIPGCIRNRNDNPDDDYTAEDYANYLKAFIKLSLKYPKVVIAERWNLFIEGAGLTGQTIMNGPSAANLFEENNESEFAKAILSRNLIANTPVFKQLRKAVIFALSGMTSDSVQIGIIQRLVWNAIIPMIILVYAWIKLLIQKKWYLWFICTAVIIKIPIVVLTQPSSWFMYVLSFYFLGYVFIVYKLWINLSQKKGVRRYE